MTVLSTSRVIHTCGNCPHLLTAHTVPDGRCLLCDCAGWRDAPPVDQRAERHDFVVRVLSTCRWPGCADEYALQAAAEARLASTKAPVEREVILSRRDRVDLLVAGVAIECKVAGEADAVLAQLTRYAASDRVDSLVLLTRRAQHRRLPTEAGGKRLTVVSTGSVL